MKKTFLVIFFFFSSVSLFAQDRSLQQVAAAVEQLKKAILDGDSVALLNITDPALTYGHSAGKIEDQKLFVSNLASGLSDFKTMELSNQTIVVKGKTAIVRHQLEGSIVDHGKAASVKLGVILVWHKQKRHWRLLARQAIKL